MDEQGIIEVLTHLRCDKIRSSGGNVKTNCPLAPWLHESGHDNHPSMSVLVNPTGASKYVCFTCRSRGSTLLGMLFDIRRQGGSVSEDLFNKVRGIEKVDASSRSEIYENKFGRDILVGLQRDEMAAWDEEELADYIGKVPRYIVDRGIAVDTCKSYELGYDEGKQRVIFPVRRKDGLLVGAMGRTIVDGVNPTYCTYLAFPKSRYLYGEQYLKDTSDPTMAEGMGLDLPGEGAIIIVEGMMDVLKLFQLGYENVVGIMTAEVSDAQARTLVSYGRPIYLMLDWDKAGVRGRIGALRKLYGKQLVFDVPGVTECHACGSRWCKIESGKNASKLFCRDCGELWEIDKDKKDPDQLTTDEQLDCLRNARIIKVSS